MSHSSQLIRLAVLVFIAGVATGTVDAFEPSALETGLQALAEKRASGDSTAVEISLAPGRVVLSDTVRIDRKLVGDGLTIRGSISPPTIVTGAVSLSLNGQDEQFARYTVPAAFKNQTRPTTLLINGQLKTAARFPREGYLRIAQSLPDRRSGFVFNEGDLPASVNADTGAIDLVFFHDWSTSRLPVASVDHATRTLKSVGPIGCAAPHYAIDHFEKQPRYYLEGHPSFATRAGDWYYDGEHQEIVVLAGATEPPTVEYPALEQLLIVSGDDDGPVENFRLEGLTFSGSRFAMPAGGYAGAQATMHEPRGANGDRLTSNRPVANAAVQIAVATDAVVNNCRFVDLGGSGLWLGSRTKSCEITHCLFERIGGNGLNLGEDRSRQFNGRSWLDAAPEQVPTANTVRNCTIQQPGELLFGAVGIWASFHAELTIERNVIASCPYTGISLGWQWNDGETPARENVIRNNSITHVMQKLSDGGGIYTLGRQPGSVLAGNRISNVPLNAGRAESNGMFLDEGTTGFTIEHNTFWDIDRSPLRFHKAGKNVARENRWTPATSETPFVRYNSTPEANIELGENPKVDPPVQ